MNKCENIFITFKNQSFDEIIKFNLDGSISNKDLVIFRAVF